MTISPPCVNDCITRLSSPTSCCLSGGTSKGAGDVSYRVVAELDDPGIVAHGVALKPGKPICLAATRGRAVVVLPGFPTSAIFHLPRVRGASDSPAGGPRLRGANGRASQARRQGQQRDRPHGISCWSGWSKRRTKGPTSLAAYPMGQGSGSVTTFSRADGFATIGRHEEIVQAGTTIIDVQLLGRDLQLGRSRGDRQPLHRARLSARRVAAAGCALQSFSPWAARPDWMPPSAANAMSRVSICSIRRATNTIGRS